jgi:hypothetical protein
MVADPTLNTASVQNSSNDYSTLRYHLATDVPVFWFPLVPDATSMAMFNRLILRRIGSDGQPHDVLPAGSILKPGTSLSIRQEEVPREGSRVYRSHHSVRGSDGNVLLWTGRSKTVGRGEASSGLRYDIAVA